LIAKKILKDPNLSHIASLKFHDTIDRVNDDTMCLKETILTDLIEPQIVKKDTGFEVELP